MKGFVLAFGDRAPGLDLDPAFAHQLLVRNELIEAITHLAFYAGGPKAMSAMAVAKTLLAEEHSRPEGTAGTVAPRNGTGTAQPSRPGTSSSAVGSASRSRQVPSTA